MKGLVAIAALASLPAIAPPAPAQEIFIVPDAFTVARVQPFNLALTESDHFPQLGHMPPNAPGMTRSSSGTSVWVAGGATSKREGHYEAHSFNVLPADENAARYAYEPEHPGWVKLGASMPGETAELNGADAATFLDAMYMTPSERAAYARPTGAITVSQHELVAESFVCVRRCDIPGVTVNASNFFRAVPQSGLRAFSLHVASGGTIVPAPDFPVDLVTSAERRTLRTNTDGVLAIPDDIHGIVMLSATLRRPPVRADESYSESGRTLTFELP